VKQKWHETRQKRYGPAVLMVMPLLQPRNGAAVVRARKLARRLM
jgi:hypothetical protein